MTNENDFKRLKNLNSARDNFMVLNFDSRLKLADFEEEMVLYADLEFGIEFPIEFQSR